MKKLCSSPKLKGLDFTTEEVLEARDKNRLLMVSIFVSSTCDLRCKYCYASSGKKLPNELSTEEYKNVIRQGKELGARTVWIPGAGEPLLQKDFKEIVKYIHSLGMTLVMFTNSTYMTSEMANFLYKNGVTVITKLNSFDKRIQEELSGKNSYAKIQRGLHNLIKVGFNKNTPTRLGVESIICKLNYDSLPKIFRFARQNNVYPYLELMAHVGRAKDNPDLKLTNDEEREMFYKLLEIDEKEFGFTWKPVPPYVADVCNKLFYNISIDSQGNVKPCCASNIIIGNIREKPLKEILSSSETLKITRFLDKHINGNLGSKYGIPNYYGCVSEKCKEDLCKPYHRAWELKS